MITLRPVLKTDLDRFFDLQQDEQANRMAGFQARSPKDRGVFEYFWRGLVTDPDVTARTIEVDGAVTGHIVAFPVEEGHEVVFRIAREQWGQGITTSALEQFLAEVPQRPLQARVVQDNAGSVRVLEKCGFVPAGESSDFSNARGEVVRELVMRLA